MLKPFKINRDKKKKAKPIPHSDIGDSEKAVLACEESKKGK